MIQSDWEEQSLWSESLHSSKSPMVTRFTWKKNINTCNTNETNLGPEFLVKKVMVTFLTGKYEYDLRFL